MQRLISYTPILAAIILVIALASCPRYAAAEPANNLAAAAYVVAKNDSGEIVARSGSGDVVAKGTDAAEVIQAAIDRLPTNGGKVYIAAGRYEINNTIRIEDKHGVHVEGAARGILFGRGGTCLHSNKAIDMIHINGGKLKVAGVTVSNLYLMGSGKDNRKTGILVTGNSDLLSLHHVGANRFGIGFHFKGGTEGRGVGVIDAPQIEFCDPQANGIGLKIEAVHYLNVVGGQYTDSARYGIMISSEDPGHGRSGGIKIMGVTGIRNGEGGILIGSNSDCISVTAGCEFGGSSRGSGVVVANDREGGKAPRNVIITGVQAYNNKHAGIHVKQGEHVVIGQCICSNHDHVAVPNHEQPYGIHVAAGAKNVLVGENITHSNGKQGVLQDGKKSGGD